MLSRLNPHLRNSVYYGISMLLPRALFFLLIPVFTRWLPPSDFGIYMLLNACLNALRLLLAMGFVPALVWSFNFQKTSVRETLGTAMTFLGGSGIVLCSALTLAAPWICNDLASGAFPPGLFRLVVLTALLESLELVAFAFFRSQGEAGHFARLGVYRFVAEAALRLFFLIVLERGVGGLIEGGLLASGAMFLVTLFFLRGHLAFNLSWPVLRGLLSFGLPLVPLHLSMMLMDVADRYILNHYATAREVGIYALGYNVGMAVNLVTQTVNLGWLPLMYRLVKRTDAASLIGRLTTAYAALLAFTALGLVAFGGDLVRLMSAPAYHSAALIVPAIALAYALQGLAQFTNIGINTRGRTALSGGIAVTFAAISIALNIALIPRFGMAGAMWTTLIVSIAMSATTMLVNQRLFAIAYDHARLAAITTTALVLGAAAAASDQLPPSAALPLKVLIIAALPALLLLTRVFNRTDLAKLRGLIR